MWEAYMRTLVWNKDNAVQGILASLVEEVCPNCSIHVVSSRKEAEKMLKVYTFDLALLDMTVCEKEDTLSIGKQFSQKNPRAELIILGEGPELAMEAFRIHPYDFHVKPVDKVALYRSIEEAVERLWKKTYFAGKGKTARLLVRSKKKIQWVPYSRILFIEKVQRGVLVHTQTESIQMYVSMSEIEKKLPHFFLRVHSSYIVNVGYVSKIIERGDRTYEIFFFDCEKSAHMSRYKAPVLLDQLE